VFKLQVVEVYKDVPVERTIERVVEVVKEGGLMLVFTLLKGNSSVCGSLLAALKCLCAPK